MSRVYRDRAEAGRLLAESVQRCVGSQPAIVLGLPRGGVSVAMQIARALRLPLDVLVVRKVGVPNQPELAMGAVASGDVTIRNEEVLAALPGAAEMFDDVARMERTEVERRERAYRGNRPPLKLAGLSAILVDDGVATGSTLRAAVTAARQLGASRVTVAVPVAPAEALSALQEDADEVICLETPAAFYAVGQWYAEFPQVTDYEVRKLLEPTSA